MIVVVGVLSAVSVLRGATVAPWPMTVVVTMLLIGIGGAALAARRPFGVAMNLCAPIAGDRVGFLRRPGCGRAGRPVAVGSAACGVAIAYLYGLVFRLLQTCSAGRAGSAGGIPLGG